MYALTHVYRKDEEKFLKYKTNTTIVLIFWWTKKEKKKKKWKNRVAKAGISWAKQVNIKCVSSESIHLYPSILLRCHIHMQTLFWNGEFHSSITITKTHEQNIDWHGIIHLHIPVQQNIRSMFIIMALVMRIKATEK